MGMSSGLGVKVVLEGGRRRRLSPDGLKNRIQRKPRKVFEIWTWKMKRTHKKRAVFLLGSPAKPCTTAMWQERLPKKSMQRKKGLTCQSPQFKRLTKPSTMPSSTPFT